MSSLMLRSSIVLERDESVIRPGPGFVCAHIHDREPVFTRVIRDRVWEVIARLRFRVLGRLRAVSMYRNALMRDVSRMRELT